MVNGTRHCEVVQFPKGYGFIQPQAGGKDVFVHISAVEKAGLSGLNEGQVVEYEEVANRGKTSAENLRFDLGPALLLALRVADREWRAPPLSGFLHIPEVADALRHLPEQSPCTTNRVGGYRQ